MRYLVKDSKKKTQAAPTMNSSTWNEWISFIRKVSATESELRVRVTTKEITVQNMSRVANTYSSLRNNHKYYVRLDIKKNGSDIGINRIGLGNTALYAKTGIATATGPNLTVNVNNSSFDTTDEFEVKIEAFDLTEDFGAGNEPTDVTFCQNYYGADYITNGTHYEHTDYYAMNGRNKEMEVIG